MAILTIIGADPTAFPSTIFTECVPRRYNFALEYR